MTTVAFTNETFNAALLQQEVPVFVNFWATWSVACLMYVDRFDDAGELSRNTAIYGTVDIDLLPELTEQYSIVTIPTTLVFFKGEIVKQFMGIQEAETLQKLAYELVGQRIPVLDTQDVEK